MLQEIYYKFVIFFFFTESYETCLTPNGSQGFCQPVKSCASILKMLEQNLTPQVRQFLQKSQCVAGQPWVCCPDQVSASVTPVRAPVRASPTITSKLPKAPACGIESSDRIYGGETTRIDEYPWLVQIQYTKREIKCPAKVFRMVKIFCNFSWWQKGLQLWWQFDKPEICYHCSTLCLKSSYFMEAYRRQAWRMGYINSSRLR